jgi:hypothetical protein
MGSTGKGVGGAAKGSASSVTPVLMGNFGPQLLRTVLDAESKTLATVSSARSALFPLDTPLIVPTADLRARMSILWSMKAPHVARLGIAYALRARLCPRVLRACIGKAVLPSLRENARYASLVRWANSARIVLD